MELTCYHAAPSLKPHLGEDQFTLGLCGVFVENTHRLCGTVTVLKELFSCQNARVTAGWTGQLKFAHFAFY